jgi:hypothetical protein
MHNVEENILKDGMTGQVENQILEPRLVQDENLKTTLR